MKNTKAALAAIGILAAALAAPAAAQEAGWYAGGSIGYSQYKNICNRTNLPCDSTDVAWRGFGGRQFSRHFAAEMRAMLAHRIERVLPLVAAPTLVVRGEHDRVAPARWAAEAARLAGGGWIEIPDAGHAVHFDRPDRVAAAIRGLLRGG